MLPGPVSMRRRRQAVAQRRWSSPLPPQPVMTAWTTARGGSSSERRARHRVEGASRPRPSLAMSRREGSPAQVRQRLKVAMNSAGVPAVSGSGHRSYPSASGTARGGRGSAGRCRLRACGAALPGRSWPAAFGHAWLWLSSLPEPLSALLAYHAIRMRQLAKLQFTDIRDGQLHLDDQVLLAGPVRDRVNDYLDPRVAIWPIY
jgi:hypothetical protein